MNVSGPEEERPIAWTAIEADEPVRSADGQQVGAILDVLGAEDIFHGIVVTGGALHHEIMVAADQVGAITNRQVMIKLTAEEVRNLPPYQSTQSYQLGFTGLLHRLGWVREEDKGDI